MAQLKLKRPYLVTVVVICLLDLVYDCAALVACAIYVFYPLGRKIIVDYEDEELAYHWTGIEIIQSCWFVVCVFNLLYLAYGITYSHFLGSLIFIRWKRMGCEDTNLDEVRVLFYYPAQVVVLCAIIASHWVIGIDWKWIVVCFLLRAALSSVFILCFHKFPSAIIQEDAAETSGNSSLDTSQDEEEDGKENESEV